MIKELAKRILYPHAHSSEAFADYLRHRGVEVGEGCYFFDAQTITSTCSGRTCFGLGST